MHADATTSQKQLILVTVEAIAARQNAARTEIAAQSRCPKIFHRLLELLQSTQHGRRTALTGNLYGLDQLPVLIHRSDIACYCGRPY